MNRGKFAAIILVSAFAGAGATLLLGGNEAVSRVATAAKPESAAAASPAAPDAALQAADFGILAGNMIVARVDGAEITLAAAKKMIDPQVLEKWSEQDADVYRLRRQALDEIVGERQPKDVTVYLTDPVVRQQVPSDTTSGRSFGPENAPVKIVVYHDYQCPYCGRLESSLVGVREKYGDKVRTEYRDFPLSFHAQARIAGLSARCAAREGHFNEVHKALFEQSRELGLEAVVAMAEASGIDKEKFSACLKDETMSSLVDADMEQGQALGVQGTPKSFINGIPVGGAVPMPQIAAIVDGELTEKRPVASAEEAVKALSEGTAAVLDGKPVTIAEVDERAGKQLTRKISMFNGAIKPYVLDAVDKLVLEQLKPKHNIEILFDVQ